MGKCLSYALAGILFLAIGAAAWRAQAALPLFLWEKAPGALGDGIGDKPRLIVFAPPKEKANGTAAIICPGGAYQMLGASEGEDIALWLNRLGVTAFVLHYRLAPGYHSPTQERDVLRAIRMVRHRAAEYGVKPSRIGMVGFSAGGHLAAVAATHFDAGDPAQVDPIERVSSRPDFMILGYPVITMMPPYAHELSAANLGIADDEKMRRYLSPELNVRKNTPPAFIFHTRDDSVVPVQNSEIFYAALRKASIPAELHIYETGPHGFGLADGKNSPNIPSLAIWTKQAESWMRKQGVLE